MADRVSLAVRSAMMSRVKNKNTSIEIQVRRHLHALGFRFRKNVKALPGSPDIVLHKYKTIVQVHGCFWHGHQNCKKGKLSQSRKDWWEKKIQRNKELDKLNKEKLEQMNWKVFEIWGCQLAAGNECLEELIEYLNKQKRTISLA